MFTCWLMFSPIIQQLQWCLLFIYSQQSQTQRLFILKSANFHIKKHQSAIKILSEAIQGGCKAGADFEDDSFFCMKRRAWHHVWYDWFVHVVLYLLRFCVLSYHDVGPLRSSSWPPCVVIPLWASFYQHICCPSSAHVLAHVLDSSHNCSSVKTPGLCTLVFIGI